MEKKLCSTSNVHWDTEDWIVQFYHTREITTRYIEVDFIADDCKPRCIDLNVWNPPINGKISQQTSNMMPTIRSRHFVIRYTSKNFRRRAAYGVGNLASYNTSIINLELFISWDINLNPGPNTPPGLREHLHHQRSSNRGLKICQWNIQRLTDSKHEELKMLLNTTQSDMDVLILSETFCSKDVPDSFYGISGYVIFRKDRFGKIGGGIMAYVKESLQVKRRNDLETENVETLWLELCPYKSKRPLLIAGVYRPPSNKVADDVELGKNIENVYLTGREMIILGDFNIDFLSATKFKKHSLVKTLVNLHIVQLVKVITRPVSKSCLDHIWSSHPERINNVHVGNLGMSDHLPVIATRVYNRVRTNEAKHKTIGYRNIKNLNKEQFIGALRNAPWDSIFVFEECDDIIDAWYKLFNSIIEEFLPQIQKRVKRRVQPNWFDADINQAINSRDKLLKKARKSKSEADYNAFKKAKNIVTQQIRSAKQAYFKDKVIENKNNPRKLWNLIKCLSKNSEVNETGISYLIEDGKNISDKQTIAEILNTFFIEQPKDLIADFGPRTIFQTMTETGQSSKFDIPPISQTRVNELLLSIPSHKATGNDGISIKLLKIAAPAISPSLTKLLNHCLSSLSFPSVWKIARVTPVFKKNGGKYDKHNYRPISVLPVLSKLLEKHICEHLYSYLKTNGLLHRLQSGFRKSFSTETALLRIVDQMLLDLDKDNVTGLVFVDYKKAFDLIDHDLLLLKLKSLGVGEDLLPIFRDYLSGRTQYVDIDGHYSTKRAVSLGVPQGSILGPVLFLIFINDLPTVIQHSMVDIYADDTTISYSSNFKTAAGDISNCLQKNVNETMEWSAENRMVLNDSKTKVMLVTGKRLVKRMDDSLLRVRMNSFELEQVDVFNLLGIRIDSLLTFDQHVEKLCEKVAQRIGVLRKIKHFLPLEQRKLYYNAMIKPTLLYGSTVWISCSKENIRRVFKLQKRAARVILNADTRANSVQLFKRLGWIPFFDEAKVNRAMLVHKRLYGDCPAYLTQMLPRNVDVNSRSTRRGNINLVCPRFKRETEGGKSFTVASIRFWNNLPDKIKTIQSLSNFKKAIMQYFRDKYLEVDHFNIT